MKQTFTFNSITKFACLAFLSLLFTSCSEAIYATADFVDAALKLGWILFKIGFVIMVIWYLAVFIIAYFNKK